MVRGGYGIYYGALLYAEFGGDLQNGFNSTPNFPSQNGFDPAFQLDTGFPAFPRPPFIDPTLSNNGNIEYVAKTDTKPSMVQNWSLEVQHELAKDLILSVAYVGSHGTRLRSQLRNTNDLQPQFLSLGNLLNANINDPAAVAAGITPPYPGFNGSVSQALRPFPQYQSINSDCCLENLGQSTYNSLQVKLERRFRNGLNLLTSYTFSKTITDADSALPIFATFAGGGGTQNPFNRRGEKSLSNQDIPHTLVVSYIYELPIGQGRKFLNKGGALNRIVGGWQVGGIQRYQSGQPLNFGCAQGIPGYDNCIRFNQVAGESVLSAAALNHTFDPFNTSLGPDGIPLNVFFNKAAFQDPNPPGGPPPGTPYQFGNQSRVTRFRSYNYFSEDFSIIKNTHITESSYVQFKVDLLNAFNRHIFARPDTGVTSPTFGQIFDTINGPRVMQLELKFIF